MTGWEYLRHFGEGRRLGSDKDNTSDTGDDRC